MAATAEMLRKRAELFRAVRSFFQDHGYLEVDTPHRLPAPLPEPYIIPQESGGWFLHTSPESCMKRLLARGIPRLFQICHCFRKGERGRTHLPEFTLLEWYRLDADYQDLMRDCEELVAFLLARLAWPLPRTSSGRPRRFAPPWRRLTVAEAFERHASLTVREALARQLFDDCLVAQVEPGLGDEPVILYDYPVELGALARRKPGQPALAERFELYLAGLEIANGFSELTDAREQRFRFQQDLERIASLPRPPGPMPERFLADLERLPPSAGIAMGLDRLLMALTGATAIDQVVPFVPEEL